MRIYSFVAGITDSLTWLFLIIIIIINLLIAYSAFKFSFKARHMQTSYGFMIIRIWKTMYNIISCGDIHIPSWLGLSNTPIGLSLFNNLFLDQSLHIVYRTILAVWIIVLRNIQSTVNLLNILCHFPIQNRKANNPQKT